MRSMLLLQKALVWASVLPSTTQVANKRHHLTLLNAWRCVLHCNMTWFNFITVWHHAKWLCADKRDG